jgi:hypothetical protein
MYTERDYYPYWSPTPWLDLAILTNDISRCSYYQSESQNVKSRWVCLPPQAVANNANANTPITQESCTAIGGVWSEVPSWGLPPPACVEAPWSRDNHLGNGVGGDQLTYLWDVPYLSRANLTIEHPHISLRECAFRIRYNITTAEYEPWGTATANMTDARLGVRESVCVVCVLYV